MAGACEAAGRDVSELTLIAVTHELGFAKRVADRIVGLFDGRVREDGPAEAVLTQPRTAEMREFLEQAFV